MKSQKKIGIVKFLTFSFIVLSFTFLSGCGIRFADSKVRCPEFALGNKAIIITRVDHRYKGLIFNGQVSVTYEIAKVDSRYPDKKTRLLYTDGGALWRSGYNFLMIEPGTYVIDKVSYEVGDTMYYSTLDGLNPSTEHFVYGGFCVKPGEIVYLGDLNVGNDEQCIITPMDNYDLAVKAFVKKYPELSNYPIKKKLLCPRGTLFKDNM